MKCRFTRHSLRLSPNQTQPPPPPLKKRALLIGIQSIRQDTVGITQEIYERIAEEDVDAVPKRKKKKKQKDRDEEGATKAAELKGPHRDVMQMKQLLIDVYEYDPKDITVLIDDDNPDHLQPTKENMIQKMLELVDGALAGDRFFFHFSGHATQEDTDSPDEEDGKDELIITSDGKTIKDDYLKKLLVDPLPIGSSLVAIFDSCHSCSLLDLEHFRCNRVHVPWLNKERPKADFPRNVMMRRNARIDVSLRSVTQAKRLSQSAITWKRTSIDQVLSSPVTSSGTFDRAQMSPIRTKSKKSLSISTDMEKESWYGRAMSPIDRCSFPESMYCTGECRVNPSEKGRLSADVIFLSWKDSQRSWEDSQGSSMTQALIKVLKNDPNPSLKDLLTLVSHDLHVFYVSMHSNAGKYKEQVKTYNDSRQQEGKEEKKPKSVEMNNFQIPQISSMQPLVRLSVIRLFVHFVCVLTYEPALASVMTTDKLSFRSY